MTTRLLVQRLALLLAQSLLLLATVPALAQETPTKTNEVQPSPPPSDLRLTVGGGAGPTPVIDADISGRFWVRSWIGLGGRLAALAYLLDHGEQRGVLMLQPEAHLVVARWGHIYVALNLAAGAGYHEAREPSSEPCLDPTNDDCSVPTDRGFTPTASAGIELTAFNDALTYSVALRASAWDGGQALTGTVGIGLRLD